MHDFWWALQTYPASRMNVARFERIENARSAEELIALYNCSQFGQLELDGAAICL
jgi:hypothetical protein